jgi:hypothetical protein
MRTDTCANCGQTIHLLKIGPDTFRWVTDPEKPDQTAHCLEPNTYRPTHQLHHPVSARETHR